MYSIEQIRQAGKEAETSDIATESLVKTLQKIFGEEQYDVATVSNAKALLSAFKSMRSHDGAIFIVGPEDLIDIMDISGRTSAGAQQPTIKSHYWA